MRLPAYVLISVWTNAVRSHAEHAKVFAQAGCDKMECDGEEGDTGLSIVQKGMTKTRTIKVHEEPATASEIFHQERYEDLAPMLVQLPAGDNFSHLAARLRNLTEAALHDAHQADTQLTSQLHDTYTACNSAYANEESAIQSLEQAMASQRVVHQDCRIEEATAIITNDTACQQFANFITPNWNVPPTDIAVPGDSCAMEKSVFASGETAAAGTFIEQHLGFVQWQVGKWGQYAQFFKACRSKQMILKHKSALCLAKQAQFEIEACGVASMQTVQCDARTQCIDQNNAAISSQCPDVQSRVSARKYFCARAEELSCILIELFKKEDVNASLADLKAAKESCQNKESHNATCQQKYFLNCPSNPTPPPTPCPPILRPGEPAFFQREYQSPNGLLYQKNSTTLNTNQVHEADASLQCPATEANVSCAATQRRLCGSHINSSDHCTCVDCPQGMVGTSGTCEQVDFATGETDSTGEWAVKCQEVPATGVYFKLSVNGCDDYYKPIQGATSCDMLTSYNKHLWSSDGVNWVQPTYTKYQKMLGGNAKNSLNHNGQGQREWLSFWGQDVGGHGWRGCNDPTDPNGPGDWGKQGTMSVYNS